MSDQVTTIEKFFGEEFSPDLIQKVSQADHKTLHAFREHHREFEKAYKLPEPLRKHHRPYISADALRYPEFTHGLSIGETTRIYESGDPARLFRAADNLKHHLLYCHSIVLNSPVGFITDLFFSERTESFEWHRANLAQFLMFLNDIKPLVQEGIVIFLPRRRSIWPKKRYFENYPPRILSQANRTSLVEHSDFSQLKRYVPAHAVDEPRYKENVFIPLAEQSILITLIEEKEYESRLDLYMPYGYFTDVFRTLLPVLAHAGIDKQITEDSIRIHELGAIDLPGLESLAPEDIVSLRRDEEASQTWRLGLSGALDRLGRLDPGLLDRDAERAVLQDELSESARKIAEKVDNSGFLKNLKRGARAFSLGAVGAFATMPLRDPVAPLIAGGVTAAADLLLTFLSRESDKGKRAFLRHFACLEP